MFKLNRLLLLLILLVSCTENENFFIEKYSREKSLSSLNIGLEKFPQSIKLHELRFSYFIENDNFNLAKKDYEYLTIKNKNPDGLIFYYANEEYNSKDNDRVLKILQISKNYEIDVRFRFLRGLIFFEKGNFSNSMIDFDYCIKNNYKLAESHYWRGMIFFSIKEINAAKKELEHSNKLGDKYAKEILKLYSLYFY